MGFDEIDLERFVNAQSPVDEAVYKALAAGLKTSLRTI